MDEEAGGTAWREDGVGAEELGGDGVKEVAAGVEVVVAEEEGMELEEASGGFSTRRGDEAGKGIGARA